jgi:hypothetical protein
MADRQPVPNDLDDVIPEITEFLNAATEAAARAAIGAEAVESARSITLSDGSTSGSAVVVVQTGDHVVGPMVGVSGGASNTISYAAFFDALFGNLGSSQLDLLVDSITLALGDGGAWQQGGSGTQAPSAPASDAWTLTNPATTGDLLITYTGALPAEGSSVITKIQYDLDASDSWVDATGLAFTAGALTVGPPDTHTITGLTDNVEYDVRIRAVSADGNGTASTAKSATPTAPAAYTPVYVDNNDTGHITVAAGGYGSDSTVVTIGIVGNMNTDAGDVYVDPFNAGNDRIRIRYNHTQQRFYFEIRNTANTVIANYTNNHLRGVPFSYVLSFNGTAGTISIWKDGAALSVTGDPATGLAAPVAATTGTLDHNRLNGLSICAFDTDMLIAEFFLDTQNALDPATFYTSGALKDWNTLGYSPQIGLGSGMTAAEWNDADTYHYGSATLTVGSATFTSV